MSRVPKHIQSARNLHANDVKQCECGAFVAVEFWEMHLREEHGFRNYGG